VEDGGCDDEKAEDDDLDDETGDDDVVTHVAVFGAVCGSKEAGTWEVVLAFVRSNLDYNTENAYQKTASRTREYRQRRRAS
jgi:hypothetical protein